MRKILSIVLVLALVLSSAGMAFAAPSSVSADVEDKTVKAAVERLVAFGIVNGMDDGKYHPEKEVTREQFAKILVTALGMESAAGAVSSTSFTDVASDRWSAGYVEVAAGQGLIKGYPDGTFQPTKGVSYAEAVTMLVRALGYKDEFLSGSWPANYIAKASSEGITKKVNFSSSTKVADRGSVAVMVNNTLDAEVITVSQYEDNVVKYSETDETLLEEKLNIETVENARFLENAKLESGLDKNEVRVIFTKDVKEDGKTKYEKNDTQKFEIVDGFDSDYYLGLDTTIYLNDDDEIVYAEINETGNTVFRNERLDYYYEDKPEGEITLYYSEEELEVDTDTVVVYLDGEKMKSDSAIESALSQEVFGTFIADDDELVYANLITWEEKDYLVQEVKEDDDTIVYLNTANGSDEKKKDLGDDYDRYEIYLVDGQDLVKMDLEDLEEFDVFNVAVIEEDGDDVAVLYVWRNSVVGEVGKVKGGNNDQRVKVEIDSEFYNMESNFTYSDDNGDDFSSADGTTIDGRDKLEDFYGEEIAAYKNWKDRVVYITGDVNSTSDELYGVVLKYGSGIEEEIKLYTKDDDEVVYKFEESDDFEWLEANVPVGSIIKYELTKEGEIAEYGSYTGVVFEVDDTATIESGDDFGSKSVKIDGKTFYVTDDTVFFDYTEQDKDDVEVFDWEDIKGKDVEKDVTVIYDADGSDLTLLAVWNNLDDIRDDVMVGYVIDTYKVDGDYFAEVAVYDKDDTQKYEIGSKLEKEIKDGLLLDGRVILFETTSGGKLELTTDSAWEIAAGMVEDIDGDKITVNGEDYVVEDDAVVYDGSKEISFSKIDDDDFVVVAAEKGEVKAMELVYAKTSSDELVEDAKVLSIDPFKVDDDDVEDIKFVDDVADALVADGYAKYDSAELYLGKKVTFLYDEDYDEIRVIWAETANDSVEEEDEDVVAVEEAIEALPDADDITLDDEDDVVAAREAFDDLTSAQQDEVDADLVDKLEECEAKIEELKNNQGGDEVTGSVEKAANNPIFGMTTITVTLDGTDTPEDYTVTIDGTEIPFKSTVHKLTVASSDDLAKMTEAELEDALVIEEK